MKEKLKAKKTELLLILGIISAVLLVLISGCEKDEEKTVDITVTSIEYEESIEQRLTDLVSEIDGVSNVKVMVTSDCGVESVYAQDSQKSENSSSSEYFLNGEKEAVLLKEVRPKVRGVAIVCRGGNDPIIQQKIISLVSSVLEISSNRVFVGS